VAFTITLAHDDPRERALAIQLLRLLDTYQLARWTYTREVRADRAQVPLLIELA
jgi:hypothetical protein